MMKQWLLGTLTCLTTLGALPALAQTDLSVVKTAPTSVVAGDILTYDIKVTNLGPNTANNVTVSDTLPPGTTFVSVQRSQSNGPSYPLVTIQGNSITATIFKLEAKAAVLRPTELCAVGNTLFFSYNDGTHGEELWKTDGTAAGTVLVKDIVPGATGSTPVSLANVGGMLFFAANDGTNGTELWKSDGTAAGTVLVKDIFPGSTGSAPSNFASSNGTLFFAANDGISGNELWKSDGTAAGTVLVKDINPNSGNAAPSALADFDGTVFFSANNETNGAELWKSDGTAAGTVLVKDINPGSAASTISGLTRVGSTLFFAASDGTNGNELWKSDGTATGTALVKDIMAGSANSLPGSLCAVNDTLFFRATQNSTGAELWKSDGTEAGTVLVKDIYPGTTYSTPSALTNLNGAVYFAANNGTVGNELWKSDGTEAGTVLVKDIYPGASNYSNNPQYITNVGGTLYFSGISGDSAATELYKSDGTAAGTVPFRLDTPASSTLSITARVNPSTRGSLSNTATMPYNGDTNPNNNTSTAVTTVITPPSTNLALTKTAPTTVTLGQNLTYTLTAQTLGNNPAYDVVLNDLLPPGTTFVSATQTGGPAFNLTTPQVGSTGTVKATRDSLANTVPVSNPNSLCVVGNTVYFAASNSATGIELWKSDGTAAGTVMVKDIYPGNTDTYPFPPADSNPSALTNIGGTLYFAANTSANGRELWKSDGTAAGTVLVKDITPGSTDSFPTSLVNVNGTLFFNAYGGSYGRELWKSDGTAAGTVLVKDIYPTFFSSNPLNLTNVGGTLYFAATNSATGIELWKSDGTAAGTVQVKDINPGSASSAPQYLVNLGGTLFFTANDSVHGTEIWQSDGTATGTTLFKDITPGTGGTPPANLSSVNGSLYFAGYTSATGSELWKSNGTAAGTVLLKDINPGNNDSLISNIVAVNGTLYFSATTPGTGAELWKSDGTAAGTVLLKDINPGSASATVSNLTSVNGTLFFSANNGVDGVELWKSNGTAAGTVPVRAAQLSTFQIVVNVASSNTSTISNTATISSSNTDTTPNNNSATATSWVNLPPTALALSPQTVKEKLPSGTFVGTFSTTDPNVGDSFTYALVSGTGDTDNAAFTIAGSSLRTAAIFAAASQNSYAIRVRSTDASGLSTEQTFTITVTESVKPTVTLTSPTLNQKVLIANFNGDIISGTANDNAGVTSVKVRLSRKRNNVNEYWNGTDWLATQALLSATITPTGARNVTWTLDGQLPSATKLDNGAYAVQVVAIDTSGNKSDYANGTFILSADQVVPTLSVTSPTANQKVLLSQFGGSAISGQASDDTGVTAVKVRLSRKRGTTNEYWNGVDFGTASSYVDATLNGTNWTLGANTPPIGKLDTGAYQVEAYALDAAGNRSINAKVAFTLNSDSIVPTVTITTPTSNQLIDINNFGAGTINGTAADNIGVASVKLKLQRKRGTITEYWNGTTFTPTSTLFDATVTGSTSATWSYDTAIPASALDAGGYTLYATAYDAAGNKTTSPSRLFNIVGTPSAADAISAPVARSAGSS